MRRKRKCQSLSHTEGFPKKKSKIQFPRFNTSESDVYGIETDVRITKDGVFVAFHDKSADRLSKRYKEADGLGNKAKVIVENIKKSVHANSQMEREHQSEIKSHGLYQALLDEQTTNWLMTICKHKKPQYATFTTIAKQISH